MDLVSIIASGRGSLRALATSGLVMTHPPTRSGVGAVAVIVFGPADDDAAWGGEEEEGSTWPNRRYRTSPQRWGGAGTAVPPPLSLSLSPRHCHGLPDGKPYTR